MPVPPKKSGILVPPAVCHLAPPVPGVVPRLTSPTAPRPRWAGASIPGDRMNHRAGNAALFSLAILLTFFPSSLPAADPAANALRPGDYVAVIGDSITEQ